MVSAVGSGCSGDDVMWVLLTCGGGRWYLGRDGDPEGHTEQQEQDTHTHTALGESGHMPYYPFTVQTDDWIINPDVL